MWRDVDRFNVMVVMIEAMESDWRLDAKDILFAAEKWESAKGGHGLSAAGEGKRAKKDAGWLEEHRVAYEHMGLAWPPDLHDSSEVDYSFMPENRVRDAAWFFNKAFPVQDDAVGVYAQFLDVNPSLSRILGHGSQLKETDDLTGVIWKDPWVHNYIKTYVGSAKVLVRYVEGYATGPRVRLLHGQEALHAMGWDPSWFAWHPSSDAKCHDCAFLSRMAGRAFSAFSIGSAVLALMAADGLTPKEPEPTQE
eukprot:4108618-Karenia_brevis.AAC.1